MQLCLYSWSTLPTACQQMLLENINPGRLVLSAADKGSKQGAVTAVHKLVKGSKGDTKLCGDNREISLATSYIHKVDGLRSIWQFASVLAVEKLE